MANRIAQAIARTDAKLAGMNGVGRDGTSLADLDAKMDLSMGDFVGYQNAQASAFAGGKLNLDEARSIYRVLGGEVYHGDWPAGTSLATKLVITRVVGELLGVAAH